MQRQIFTSRSSEEILGRKRSVLFSLPGSTYFCQKLFIRLPYCLNALIKNTLLHSLNPFTERFRTILSSFDTAFHSFFPVNLLCVTLFLRHKRIVAFPFSLLSSFVTYRLKTHNTSCTHTACDRVPCLLSVIIPNFVLRLQKPSIPRTN